MEDSLSLPVFSKEEVNAKRQFEYDVAKAFAIVFMILVHTVDQITAGEGSLYCAIEFFGCAPSACGGVNGLYTFAPSPCTSR